MTAKPRNTLTRIESGLYSITTPEGEKYHVRGGRSNEHGQPWTLYDARNREVGRFFTLSDARNSVEVEEEGCQHENITWDGPDPSVGIFGYLVGCDDCGAEALDFEQVHDADEDGYCGFTFDVTRWGPSYAL